MRQKTLAFAFALTALSQANAADTHIKDGWPCLREICVGDRLEDLSSVSWTPAYFAPEEKKPLFRADQKGWQKYLADGRSQGVNGPDADIRKLRRYLGEGSNLDADLLPALRHIYTCKSIQLTGKYKSQSGMDTEVTIQLQPGPEKDRSAQEWRVVRIERSWPNGLKHLTSGQREQFLADVETLYGRFNEPNAHRPAFVTNTSFSLKLGWRIDGLRDDTLGSLTKADAYLEHPKCTPKMQTLD